MSRTILLVDDDIFQLKLFEKLLSSNGYNCKVALSVYEAEEILRLEKPDLIISDYEMPDKNGFEFRSRLLERDMFKNIPFLFLTSVNDKESVQKGLDLKAIDYIAKDTPSRHILSKIDNLLVTVKEHYERSLGEIKGVAEKLNLRNIPLAAPVLKNFSISYFNLSFQGHPGGDFIDFIKVSERYTFIILGDVMGKKWGAWFFSFSYLSYIRAAIRMCVYEENYVLSEILDKLNRVIHADELLKDIFSTLSMVLLDDEEGKVMYAGAGDLPLLKYGHEKEGLQSFQSAGILLGFAEEGTFDEMEISLEKEEELYMISDGMIDFEIEGRKRSDLDLLKKKIYDLKKKGETSESIRDNLFNKDVSQIDDCSIIILKKI